MYDWNACMWNACVVPRPLDIWPAGHNRAAALHPVSRKATLTSLLPLETLLGLYWDSEGLYCDSTVTLL